MLVPSHGSEKGGCPVTVVGAGFVKEGLLCSFAPMPVPRISAKHISSTSVVCFSPPMPMGTKMQTVVKVSHSAEPDFAGISLPYLYETEPTVTRVAVHVMSDGAGAVSITGSHFANLV